MVPLLTASPQAIDATIPVPNWASLSKSFIVTFATLENLGCFFSSGLTCGLEAVSRVLVFSLRRAATISQKRSETAQNHTSRVDGVRRTLSQTKCSISAIVNSRTRSRPFFGAISFLKPKPICAAAKGTLPLL